MDIALKNCSVIETTDSQDFNRSTTNCDPLTVRAGACKTSLVTATGKAHSVQHFTISQYFSTTQF